MADGPPPPAFYARAGGRAGEWWTVLHPPYTVWHLSYVVIGASLAPSLDAGRLAATVAAFFLAVGMGAHALDELNGRPLRTGIPARTLAGVGAACIAGAGAIGIVLVLEVGWVLAPFVVAGVVLAAAYSLEWFGGRLHTAAAFAIAWGGFPLLFGYVGQTGRLDPPALLAAAGACGLSAAQRALSTPARLLRRKVATLQGTIELAGGDVQRLTAGWLLGPLENALRALSWGVVALAAGALTARLLG
ncbi:hypothetical protein BH18ACT15_BH18ACT15_14120 [soil metagenome]